MTAGEQRAARVAELVETALERPPAGRAAFLDETCAEDAVLRAEVESLLRQLDGVDGFLETSLGRLRAEAFGHGAETEDAGESGGRFAPGDTLGDCRIVSLLGEGGMGEVYLAEDTALGRQVAVKIVRRGPLGAGNLLRHFRHEERILAGLNHPHIARLYGGAVSADGVPYFVMEYVEGERLDTFCDARRLPVDERLHLFRKVCGAVAYAHQHLVIHRDLKPANILVTAEGEPKLLDFGIAKLLDPDTTAPGAEPTLTLQGVMTPEYASPEQARGEAMTTASDVYSLGVILYELLSGHRPYRLKSRRQEEIVRAIGEQAPERPSTVVSRTEGTAVADQANGARAEEITPETVSLARGASSPEKLRRRLAGDLDNIVLMAMRKEPARRYASVGQFSEDLRRHLAGLPVLARRDTLAYRSTKFVARNRVAVTAAALIALALIGGLIATFWQANRATRQARLAAQQRDRAERRFEDVRELSNALLFEIAPRIERLENSMEARQSLLTQSLKYLDRLAQESGDHGALKSELATAYEKVGDLQGNPTNPNLIALQDALISYEKANAIRRGLLDRNPHDAEQRRRLANNYRVLGDIRWQTNEPAESLKNSEAALRLYTELLADQPGSPELRLALARTHHDIGMNLSTNGKRTGSIVYFQKAIAAAEELRRQAPDRVEVLTLLANGHKQMGSALSWELQQQPAEAEMAEAIAIYESLIATNPGDSSLQTGRYQTYMMTSNVYEEVNDPLANEYAFKALAIIESKVERDPANLRAKQQLAKTYSRLGVTLANVGRSAESIRYLEKAVASLQAIAQHEAKNRRFTHDLALALQRLGDARHKQGDFPGALDDLEKAAAIFSDLVSSNPTDNASLRNFAHANVSLARTHEDFASQSPGGREPSHRQMARRYFLRAADLLRQLEARNALSKFDWKSLEETQTAAQKYPAE